MVGSGTERRLAVWLDKSREDKQGHISFPHIKSREKLTFYEVGQGRRYPLTGSVLGIPIGSSKPYSIYRRNRLRKAKSLVQGAYPGLEPEVVQVRELR